MSAPIVVVNPNSTAAVTAAIDRALAPLRMAGGPAIECLTLAEGPPGIETQAQVEQVVQPLCRLVRAREDAGAFVIACFSDPGLHACREATDRPVLGIAECGLLTALTRGERFGIVAILKTSLPRHLRYVRQLGLAARFAGELPLGLGVVELTDQERTIDRMRGGRHAVARSARRRRPGVGLRRHGPVSRGPRGGARAARGRPDPGRSHDGARPRPIRDRRMTRRKAQELSGGRSPNDRWSWFIANSTPQCRIAVPIESDQSSTSIDHLWEHRLAPSGK